MGLAVCRVTGVARRDTLCASHDRRRSKVNIGECIKQQVIPAGMSVTQAAQRLGVGRPALSNLLNGRATLSQNMARRLEETFGADAKHLLDLQAASVHDRQRNADRTGPVQSEVPDFLTIKAKQIGAWAATNIDARQHLPVLLRRLIHSTGRELRRVDFPGFDNAERPGWDGEVEAETETPWVPAGRSGWEFGVSPRPQAKADHDYKARLAMLTPAERADCTFVFVTPRNWRGKHEWAAKKEVFGDWKAVRTLDASDLEQWLETTVAPRIWLAGKLGMSRTGFRTISESWDEWTAGSEPPMTAAIFAPTVDRHGRTFREWLEATPNRPFTVAADSRDEAVALIACLLRQDDLPAGSCDRAILFESPDTLGQLAQSSSSFIPVVCNDDTERAIGDVYRRRHCLVVRPRNATDREPDIAIDLLGYGAFENALADMGIERERVEHLARQSGCSPSVLRRRLSRVDAIRTPRWTREAKVAQRLIPMALVGVWHAGSGADREILKVLAEDRCYEKIEDSVADLLSYDDSPVWRVGQYCGVVSKIDALFGIAPSVRSRHIDNFLLVAEYVLSESDPSLELPENKRWMAGIYGKVREHSAALRTGVCETLVLLAVHGDSLLEEQVGFNVEQRISALVRQLLTPFTSEKLQSQDRDLPGYAEAAPDVFLTLLEEDLSQPEPALLTLLKPTESGSFDHPLRTGVLWALERLAWNPKHLMRVVVLLAKLSRTKIDDNWVNKPINSLAAIFRSWMPQTAAPVDDRIKALDALCKQFPKIGWQICIEQLDGGFLQGSYNAKPRWRSDASGAGELAAEEERSEFVHKAFNLAVAWQAGHTVRMLGDLLERLNHMHVEDQLTIWNRIDAWSLAATDDRAKSRLREQIRRTISMRREQMDGLEAEARDRARKAYERLTPRDPINRHAWLFADSWVEESADDIRNENLDWEKWKRRRTEAMNEIWSTHGFGGAMALLLMGDAARVVGYYAGPHAADARAATDLIRACLSTDAASNEKVDGFMRGFIEAIEDDVRTEVLSSCIGDSVHETARLFLCAPFGEQTWRLLDPHAQQLRDRYWKDVFPERKHFTEVEMSELIDRLVDADRPRAAFFAVHLHWDRVETSRLKRLLLAVATVDSEPAGHFEISRYDLSKALKSLTGRPGVAPDEMVQLEFSYCFRHREQGIPNIEQRLADSPALFVQVLAMVFRRMDGKQDPTAWQIDDPKQRAAIAGDSVLQQVRRIPGEKPLGQVDADALMRWVTDARRLCKQHGRTEIGDQKIGEWLSRVSSEDDARWPCRPVCELLETIASKEMAQGFKIGVYNGRGVTWRNLYEGGGQERALAARYRGWAQAWRFEYPTVGKILDAISEGYERDAAQEDTDVWVMKRLEH